MAPATLLLRQLSSFTILIGRSACDRDSTPPSPWHHAVEIPARESSENATTARAIAACSHPHPMVKQVLLHSGLDTSGSCRSQSPHPPARARSGSAGADRALAVVPGSPARSDAVSAPCPSPLVPAAGCRTLRIISSAKRQRRPPLSIMASQWVERCKIQRRRTIENHIRKQPASKRADGQARGAKPIADHQSFHVTHMAK
jgi:hypothetical protein